MNFFNKKNLEAIKNNEHRIEYGQEPITNEEIIPTLSFDSKKIMPAEDQYIYQYYNNEARPLKPNQISILAIDHFVKSGAIDVRALIRHSLSTTIELNETSVIMMNEQHEAIAEDIFDLSILGELPPRSSRPFTFRFNKKDIKEVVTTNSTISLGFKLKTKHVLDLTDEHKQHFTSAQINQLEKIVADAPELKEGEVNLMPISHKKLQNGSLAVSILLRNGSKKTLQLNQIPLELIDQKSNIIAKGIFKLDDFDVKPNTSKLHTFIFPEKNIIEPDADLSRYKVVVTKN